MGLGGLLGWGLAFCDPRERQVEKFRGRLERCQGGDSRTSPPPIVCGCSTVSFSDQDKQNRFVRSPTRRVGRRSAPGSNSRPLRSRSGAAEEGIPEGSGGEGVLQTALRSVGVPCRVCGGQIQGLFGLFDLCVRVWVVTL